MPGEFELIRRYAPSGAVRDDVLLGSGDDAALLQPPAGKVLAATTDTLVAGRHFPMATTPYDIGWKALAVNLSDLAAMGAAPAWVTVALTLPTDVAGGVDVWMAGFSAGLQDLAVQHDVAIVGGDLTAGPLSVTIQAIGSVEPGKALRRDGAQAGDVIAVTGNLGDAALALRLLQQQKPVPEPMLRRLNRPEPQLSAGQALAGIAHAALDISDGLAGDLGHILRASNVGANLYVAQLPMSEAFVEQSLPEQRLALALSGGDDYELCLCIPEKAWVNLPPDAGLTRIGVITAEPGLRLLDAEGNCMDMASTGYDHFTQQLDTSD